MNCLCAFAVSCIKPNKRIDSVEIDISGSQNANHFAFDWDHILFFTMTVLGENIFRITDYTFFQLIVRTKPFCRLKMKQLMLWLSRSRLILLRAL